MDPDSGKLYDTHKLLKEGEPVVPGSLLDSHGLVDESELEDEFDKARLRAVRDHLEGGGKLVGVSDEAAQTVRLGEREKERRKKRRKAARQARKLNRRKK